MPEAILRPPTLRTYLEAGCDLTAVPDLENYARVILIGRHGPLHDLDRLVAFFFFDQADRWLNGEDVVGPDGEVYEPSFERIRHAMWLAEGPGQGSAARSVDIPCVGAARAHRDQIGARWGGPPTALCRRP